MNNLVISQSVSTPEIHADGLLGVLRMRGDSYPENSFELFQPVHDWLTRYLKESKNPLSVDLELVYLNTSSIRAIVEIFDLIEEAHRGGREVRVLWRYDAENERVAELAQEFKEDCSFKFEIIPNE